MSEMLTLQQENEACALIAANGYRCGNCKAIFLADDGHACDEPEWESLTPNDIAAAIRARYDKEINVSGDPSVQP